MNIKNSNKFLLLYLAYSSIIAPIIFKYISKNISEYYLIFILNSAILSFIPILLYFLLQGGKDSIKEILLFRKLSRKNLLLVIAISLSIIPVSSFIALITSMFFPFVVSDAISEATKNSNFLGMFVAVGLLPAIFEEFLMRGIYLSGFRKYNLFKACIINGLVFGAIHLNWEQFFYASFIGSILCFLVLLTESIWSSVLCHFIINGTQVSLSFLQNILLSEQEVSSVQLKQTLNWSDVLLSIPQATISFLIFIYFLRLFIKENIASFESKKIQPKFKIDSFFIACIVFYFISMIFFL